MNVNFQHLNYIFSEIRSTIRNCLVSSKKSRPIVLDGVEDGRRQYNLPLSYRTAFAICCCRYIPISHVYQLSAERKCVTFLHAQSHIYTQFEPFELEDLAFFSFLCFWVAIVVILTLTLLSRLCSNRSCQLPHRIVFICACGGEQISQSN